MYVDLKHGGNCHSIRKEMKKNWDTVNIDCSEINESDDALKKFWNCDTPYSPVRSVFILHLD